MAFSFFLAPITSTVPSRDMTLQECCDYIRSDKAAASTMALRAAPSSEEHDEIKRQQFDFVTFSGTFSTRKRDGLIQYSSLMCLDFDHISLEAMDLESLKNRIAADETFPTLLVFVSPSGDGLKVVVSIECDANEHDVAYAALSLYFKQKYGLSADRQCKDIARACLLPHDPKAIFKVNEAASTFDYRAFSRPSASSIQPHHSTVEAVEYVIQQIESRKLDLTATYDRWISIGFALADEFGEAGRSFFRRISQFYPGFSREDTDQKFDYLLRTHSGAVGIGTFFFYAQEAGLLTSQNRKKNGAEPAEVRRTDPKRIGCGTCGSCGSLSDRGTDFEHDPLLGKLPSICEAVDDRLPNLLKECTTLSKSNTEKDVRLLASLAVISAALPNISGDYGDSHIYPHLYIIIDGPASSRKGKAAQARLIGEPIHDEYKRRFDTEMEEYRRTVSNQKNNADRPVPTEPKRRMFYVPANSTDSAMQSQIANNGGEGMIFEAELDTLNGAFKSQHGNYSPLLRQGFHHENFSMRRRTNDEYIDISRPRIALCISGTPGQINNFIGSAENGLFSRMLFYCTALDPAWESPWATEGETIAEDHFRAIGEHFYEFYYKRLVNHESITFTLSDEQRDTFDRVFGGIKKEYLDEEGSSLIPSVHRMGWSCFRISMIFATLRKLESGKAIPSHIICDDDSFKAAMDISTRLLEHTRFVYTHLPASLHGIHGRARAFFDALPETFDRKEYLKVADSLGMNPRTVERYITKLIASNWLKNDYNQYAKITT